MDNLQETTRHRIKIDLQGLIRLLAKNLYAENDVFMREMIQNAHDSIKKRGSLDSHSPLGTIHIRINRTQKTITFTDNGAGLTEQEIHDYLSTIGRSGTNEFRQDLILKGRQAEANLIGQFGIGLLSAFVIAYRVEVETLSMQPGSTSWLWSSDGQSDYELLAGQRQEVGTTVTLYVTDSFLDMLLVEELRKAIKKYADFIPYPIFLNDEGISANAVHAPWHLNFTSENERLEEYTTFVARRFPDDAILETIPVALRTPYRVDGVLYISDRRDITPVFEGQLEIYQSRMFVTSKNSHVLPRWAQFINGVIDSPDLTLTASRDAVQQDYVARQIHDALAEVIVQHLQSMAKKMPEQFNLIMLWHSFHIRNMALDYDDFFEAIADLMPFETNRGIMNLHRYCEQSLKLEQNDGYDIFYFSERESASRYYMLCDARAVLVINAGRSFEELFLKKYAEKRSTIRLHSLSQEGADFLFEQPSPDEEASFHRLITDFYTILVGQPIQIRVVRFKPKTIPAITNFEANAQLRQELQDKQQSVYVSKAVKELLGRVLKEQKMAQVSLFLNAENLTIQKMAQMAAAQNNDTIAYQAAIYAIYNNASLLSSHLMTPEATQNVFTSSTQTINLMIEQAEQLVQMQRKLSESQLSLRTRMPEYGERRPSAARSKQILCVVALPAYDTPTMPYETLLFQALRKVLENGPYYWQVMRANEHHLQTERANEGISPHIYIAEVTELDQQVIMDLGYICGKKQDWQVVALLQTGQTKLQLPQQKAITTLTYPAHSSHYTLPEMIELLRELFAHDEQIQRINQLREEHYLSPLFLQEELWMPAEVANALTQFYSTFEALANARSEEITSRISNLTMVKAKRLQQSILDILEGPGARE